VLAAALAFCAKLLTDRSRLIFSSGTDDIPILEESTKEERKAEDADDFVVPTDESKKLDPCSLLFPGDY
jgi:hypothetical protein